MLQLAFPLNDGHDCGPLFGPRRKLREGRGTRMPGILRRRAQRRATPPWLSRCERGRIWALWSLSRVYTRALGVVYSVDHIVPLNHPLVCGLHWHHNMRIVPLLENMQKANLWWPDMPETQASLFDHHQLEN